MQRRMAWVAVLLAVSLARGGVRPGSADPEKASAGTSAAAGTSAGAGTAAAGAGEVVADPVRQALDEAHRMLAEQAAAMRALEGRMAAQEKEIEALRVKAGSSAGAVDAAAGERAAGQLSMAAAELRGSAAAPPVEGAGGTIAVAAPLDLPAMLYFRIGHATFTPSGWVDFTSYYRSTDVGSGLGTTFQSIPYSNTVQGEQSEVRFTAQSSRIALKADEAIGEVKAYGYLEADFNGYAPGNAYVSTNSNSLRMRVYYLNLAHHQWEVLGGQEWSLLTPTRRALCPFLDGLWTTFLPDTSYQAGLVYARQPQVRVVYHPTESTAIGLSVEEPEQYSGSAVTFPAQFSTTETDINSSTGSGGANATPNVHPDVVAKMTWDPTLLKMRWHAGAAGLLTAVRVVTPATVTKGAEASDEREGGGAIGNVSLGLFRGFHLMGMGYWSDGGGRYIGGMGPGFVVLEPGSAESPFRAALIHAGSGIGGFEWAVPGRTTIASFYSGAYFQRRYGLDPSVKAPTYVGYGYPGSGNTNNRAVREISFASTTTLWQNPVYGALQFITQSSWAEREPWYLAAGSPRDAHVFMEFANLRFVLP